MTKFTLILPIALALLLPAGAALADDDCRGGQQAMNGDDQKGWAFKAYGDDDDCEEAEDDDDDDDDDEGTGARGNAAPAGTVSPPANGLFGGGAPKVSVQ